MVGYKLKFAEYCCFYFEFYFCHLLEKYYIDTVHYTGGVIAYTQSGGSLEQAVWERRNLIGREVAVESKLVNHPDGFNFEGVQITGFEKCLMGPGCVVSADDNGVYYRLPPSEDIEEMPHYLKVGQAVRHLFSFKKRWVIAKTCNAEVMGAQAYTPENKPITFNRYKYYPKNEVEKDMSVKLVLAHEAPTVLAQLASVSEIVPDIIENHGLENVVAADLESSGLGVELVCWRESNHDCVFFNNFTGQVSFLSLNPDVLRASMHPVLLNHLVSNKIDVGEDLMKLNERHWDILASLTGVERSRTDIAKVLIHLLEYSFSLFHK